MKYLLFLVVPLFLVACGNKKEESSSLNERDTKVEETLELKSADLDAMALQSLEDRNNIHPELDHLGVEYLTENYRFYTPKGRQDLVNLIINNKYTQDETKGLFKLLLSQFNSSQSNLSELEDYLKQMNSHKQKPDGLNENLKDLPIEDLNFLARTILDDGYEIDDQTIEENHERMINIIEQIVRWDHAVIFKLYSEALIIHYQNLQQHQDFYVRPDFSIGTLIGIFVQELEKQLGDIESNEHWEKNTRSLVEKMEKRTFSSLLTKKQLIAPLRYIQAPTSSNTQEMNWDMSYSTSPLGGCNAESDRSKGANLEGSDSRHCSYKRSESTNSEYSVAYSLKSKKVFGNLDIKAIIASSVRGGYQARNGFDSSKNHTVNINYKASGSIEIPICQNIVKCNPIVEVQNLNPKSNDIGRYNNFPNRPANGSRQRVLVNGQALSIGEKIFVDRSENPIVINIQLSRKDGHRGACCNGSSKGQQRVFVRVVGAENFPDMAQQGPMNDLIQNGFQTTGGFGGGRNPFIVKSPFRYNILGLDPERQQEQLGGLLLNYVRDDLNVYLDREGVPDSHRDRFVPQRTASTGHTWRMNLDQTLDNKQLSYFSTVYGSLDLIHYIKNNRSDDLKWRHSRELYLLEQAISNYSRERVVPIVNARKKASQRFVEMNIVEALELVREEVALAVELKQFELLTNTSKRLKKIIRLTQTHDIADEPRAKIEDVFRLVKEDQIQELVKNMRSLDEVIDEVKNFQDEMKLNLELSVLELAQYE